MIESKKIKYQDGDVVLEGYYSLDTSKPGKKSAVLIVHDWSGRNSFAEKKADKIAELGYLGFALDMYGNGQTGQNNEEKAALMSPLKEDRALLRNRILAAYETVKKIPEVDAARIAAMGFCFGGLCALDLARSGADVKGVVSFHGLLDAPNLDKQKILAKVLAFHGHDDPMVPPNQVLAFEDEMTKAKVDWQVHVYGNTMHGFTNPLANDPNFGAVFSELASHRSWIAMQNFFAEIL